MAVLSSAGAAGLQMSVATRDMTVQQGQPATDAGRALLIAGPTASGKSALALALAEKSGGIVINTDSMQVYRDLRIITARPTPDEEARVPHRLYGHRDAAVNCSVGSWLEDAAFALAEARAQDKLPIFIGGTGLYFKALLRGLADVPAVPANIREAVRARLERDGIEALHAELARRDPVMGERLKPRDRARVARALEVIEATGRSINDWHTLGLPPLLSPANVTAVFLAPDRAELYARIDRRFATMLEQGALDEVAALARRGLDPVLPAMKAHGVPALIRHLKAEITLAEAATIGATDTRHYAKRQFTWFRHQLGEFEWLRPEDAEGRLSGNL
jgi:tRNA dimethylallyltransferase